MSAAQITGMVAQVEALRAAQAMPAWAVTTHRAAAPLESLWQRLEAQGTAYQGHAFCKAWYDTIGMAEGAEPLIIHMLDAARGLELLWPLAVHRQAGCRIAHFAGGKHANYNMPLGTLARVDSAELRHLLLQAARTAGVDLVMLDDQPVQWAGVPHPLADLPHTPAPSSAWSTDLLGDADAMTARIMSAESLKKLRKKERKLSELGPVIYGVATTQAEVEAALGAFLQQKSKRFAAMGVPNPFAEPGTVAFLKQISTVLPTGAPMQFHTLQAGNTVAALFGGLVHGRRFSGMITSFDGDCAIARCSPGDLLLLRMIRTLGASGLTTFDLGIGDAAYKAGYCPQEDKLFNTCLAVSARGAVLGSVLKLVGRAKGRIKASPRLHVVLRRLQRS